tara:strand:- start:3184 stop:3831 length:648 start_codon:yes stop_codon:yes gene_type:complete
MDLISSAQCRAARGLLNWSQLDLANRSGMHKQTISNFEAERSIPSNTSLEKLTRILQNGGVEFGQDNAVSLPQIKYIKLEQAGWFLEFLDDVIFTLKDQKQKELLIYGGDNRVTPPAVVEKFREVREAGIEMREMVCEGNTFLMGPEEEYRWIPKQFFKNYNTVIYADRVCVDFRGRAAILIINKGWAETERNKFEMLWNAGLPVQGETTSDIRY